MCPKGHRSSSLLHGIKVRVPNGTRISVFRGRCGFSIIEILVALTILSVCVPVFLLSRQNLAADRVHRVRLAAESICHNTLERFGRAEDDLARFLAPAEEGVFEGANLWTDPQLARDLGAQAAGKLLTDHDMKMEVRLTRGVRDGLDLVVCRVSWSPEAGSKKREAIHYARHVMREGAR